MPIVLLALAELQYLDLQSLVAIAYWIVFLYVVIYIVRLTGRLDRYVKSMNEYVRQTNERLASIEDRLQAIEGTSRT